ncbi:MAG: hypothetical protein WEA24_14120 [Gemmatimonadota bacterium]
METSRLPVAILPLLVICAVHTACAAGDTTRGTDRLTWLVDPAPLLVVGADEQAPGHQFSGIRGAARLADGRLVVVDALSSEVRYFSADGTLVHTAGGEGDGPQELRRISDFSISPGDTVNLFLYLPAVARVTPDGRVADKRIFPWPPLRFNCHLAESGNAPLPDGSLLQVAGYNPGQPGCDPYIEGEMSRRDAVVARLDPISQTKDTIGFFPGTERNSPNYRVFGLDLLVAASADRIFVGETEGDSIVVFDYDGNRVGRYEVPLERQPIPADVRAIEPESRRLPDGRVVSRQPYAMPELYPRFGRLLAGRDGTLRVMAYPQVPEPISSYQLNRPGGYMDPAGQLWVVLDPDGNHIGNVRTPPGLFAVEIGTDYVLGLALDEYDVERVQLHALEGR